MKMLLCRLSRVGVSAVLGFTVCGAFAQAPVNGSGYVRLSPQTSESQYFGQSEPAPTWAVWAAFFRHLKRNSNDSSTLASNLLASRLGITEDKFERILSLGIEYLRTLEQLQQERSQTGGIAALAMPQSEVNGILSPPVQRRAPSAADLALMEKRTPLLPPTPFVRDGKTEAPTQRQDTAMGFNAMAHSALEVLQKRLADSIGPRDYAALMRWISLEFSAQVRVSQRSIQLP